MGRNLLRTVGVLLFWVGAVYAQQTGAVRGVVQDAAKLAIAGAKVTLTNLDTSVAQTTVSNEQGVYAFPVVPSGKYRLSGTLAGFKTSTIQNFAVTVAPVQFDLTMEVGNVETTVVVSVDPTQALRETGATVGEVLPDYRIRDLPLVTNDVLDLVRLMPGYLEKAGYNPDTQNSGADSIAGLDLNFVNTTVNGLSVSDGRWANLTNNDGVSSGTRINPDMVSEIRLILAPVDAEYGRGNAQVQITTRSGTNSYTGSIRFTPRNNGLNANTWLNNRNQSVDPADGKTKWRPLKPDWNNSMEYTLTYGGPILKNKTFFFVLFNQVINNTRRINSTDGAPVLTDTMREGVFRYFTQYNGAPADSGIPTATASTTSSVAYPAVNWDGSPRMPTGPRTNPGGTGYTGGPRCIDLFDRMVSPRGEPYNDAYCSQLFGGMAGAKFIHRDPAVNTGKANCPTGCVAGTPWDPRRTSIDPTGYIQSFLAHMPHPNNFAGTGDGLNAANYRFMLGKTQTGQAAATAGVGTDPDVNTWNTNIRIDHNLTNKHRLSGSWSYQPSSTHFASPDWPDGAAGLLKRKPQTGTLNLTSTMTSTLVNDFRFGVNWVNTDFFLPWNLPDQKDRDYVNNLLPNGGLLQGGVNPVNGKTYPVLYIVSNQAVLASDANNGQGAGAVGGSFNFANGLMNFTGAQGQAFGERTPLLNLQDSVSWTKGRHSLRFSGEVRFTGTNGYGLQPGGNSGSGIGTCGGATVNIAGGCNFSTYPIVYAGTATGAESPFLTTVASNLTNFLPEVNEGQANGTQMLTGATGTVASRIEQLSYELAGSVLGASMQRWVTGHQNFIDGTWDDITTAGDRMYRKETGKEWSAFVQDNWRVSKTVSVNAGLRWDYYEPRFLSNGLTVTIKDQAAGLFGVHRGAASADPLSGWLQPGNLYFTGYGQAGAAPGVAVAADSYRCTTGDQQNSLLPVSNCDPAKVSVFEFVGDGIFQLPGESTADYERRKNAAQAPRQKTNFSPSISISWQPSIFGAGKTTVRTGFSMTYGGTGRQILNSNAGSQESVSYGASNAVFSSLISATHAPNLTDVASLIPIPSVVTPRQPTPPVYSLGQGATSITAYDPDFKVPHTRNFTFAVTRNLSRSVTLNMNFVSTEGRDLQGNLNINTRNTFYNTEFFNALEAARNGADDPLLDQVLAGLNLVGTTLRSPNGTYTAVGTFNNGPDNAANTGDDVLMHGGAQLRRAAAFSQNLANGNYEAVAASLVALAANTAGMLTSPLTGITNLNGGLRNGCNRLASGATGAVGGSQPERIGFVQVAGVRNELPTTSPQNFRQIRCLPEDYLMANPQLSTANFATNLGSSDYNSLQTQVSIRPNRSGVSFTTTYSFSKTISQATSGFRDPLRHEERWISTGSVKHDFRSNGTFSLPVGPNQLFFGNTHGAVARVIEGWKMSVIYNVTGARPVNLGGGATNFYAANTFDVVGPWETPMGKIRWDGRADLNPGNALGPDGVLGTEDDGHDRGTFFGGGFPYFVLDNQDPQCRRPGVTDSMGFNINEACTLDALARYVDDIPGSPVDFIDPLTGRPARVVLQQPRPGRIGNLGKNTMTTFARWTLDANLSKDFRVRETTRVQIRLDARNVLNHPLPSNPSYNIVSGGLSEFVQQASPFNELRSKSGNRTIAGSISINFQGFPFK